MKHYRKILGILLIGFVMSVFSGGFMLHDKQALYGPAAAFAEDEKADEKKSEKDPKDEAATGETKDSAKDSDCPECPECPDSADIVLRGLEEKRTKVEKEHKAMLEEKKALQAIEEQIDEKIEKNMALKKQIEQDIALLDKKKSQKEQEKEDAYEARMRSLVNTYSKMKPKAAAKIFDAFEDVEKALGIFMRMKEASSSQILSFMDSKKAAKITERLAFKQE